METVLDRQYGKAHVTVSTEYDDSPDYSWLGEFTSYHKADASRPLYSREMDAIRLPGSDLWRNRLGRIVTEPNDDRGSREYQFVTLEGAGNGYADETKDRLKYLFQDADRLLGMNRGDWSFIGIVANVQYDGRTIGDASCWGFESDSDDSYILSEARSIAHEALLEARHYVDSLRGKAS